MSSQIDCEDLLALTTCSVEDQFSPDIKNQLSLSLLRHIAQASASAHTGSPTHPYGLSNAHRMFAPATTPTASSYTRPTATWMNASMEDPNNFSTSDPRARTSLSRSAHYHEEEDDMDMEEASSTSFSVIQTEHGDAVAGRASGTRHPFEAPYTSNSFSQQSSAFVPRHPGSYKPSLEPSSPSHFATSDPFFLAVSELQSVASCRRQLQPKAFAVSAPLQVTPNPIQFGNLAATAHSATGTGNQSLFNPSANGMFMRMEGQQTLDTALYQYR
ncbi:hypothetical protein FRC19_006220 [Serendipita sp. 401]|nr:hypothetical protein FRC19_006220 [Serendipita sp. 401]